MMMTMQPLRAGAVRATPLSSSRTAGAGLRAFAPALPRRAGGIDLASKRVVTVEAVKKDARQASSVKPQLGLAAAFAAALAPLPAMAAEATTAAVQAGQMDPMTYLGVALAETLIAWGVPLGGFGILTFFLISSAAKGKDSDDKPLFGRKRRGEPKEFLKIDRLNDRLESYQYSVDKALLGKSTAGANKARATLTRRLGDELASDLTEAQLEKIIKAEQRWLREAKEVQSGLTRAANRVRVMVTQEAVRSAPSDANGSKEKEEESAEDKADKEGGGMGTWFKGKMMGRKYAKLQAEIADGAEEWSVAEEQYLAAVAKVLDASQRARLASVLKDRAALGVGFLESPLAIGAAVEEAKGRKHLFVVNFPGDIQASQVAELRQEVTGILRAADPSRGDEVLMVLNSGGGTVTGYGLAAAQLMRVKDAGLHLTIAVEQVAASGGYMMACCADRIIASPFAVLGSIGVISEQPNVYERLKKEGIEFQTVTAGKYKRTLTPFKRPTKEDFEKSSADVEEIFQLFKGFVGSNRPALDIDKVATGETWFGKDALDRHLCDELRTVDEELLGRLDEGCEIYSVKYKEAPENPLAELIGAGATSASPAAALGLWLLARAGVPLDGLAGSVGGLGGLGGFYPPGAAPGAYQPKEMLVDPTRAAESTRSEYSDSDLWRM